MRTLLIWVGPVVGVGMKKFLIQRLPRGKQFIEAESMKIEGSAVTFLNAKMSDGIYPVFTLSLAHVLWVAETPAGAVFSDDIERI